MPRDFPTLARAPIVEGLIDIQIRPLTVENLRTIETIGDKFLDFPIKSSMTTHAIEATVQAHDPTHPFIRQDHNVIGFQFRNSANSRAFQIRLNGINFSIFAPYTTFEDLADATRTLWESFREVSGAHEVTRIGLRYINRLRLPLPMSDFTDYIKIVPEVAAGLPQGIAQFVMRLTIPDTQSDGIANITEWCEGQTEEDKLILFFDIDVFENRAIPDADIWPTISRLREFKNRIFFESITDALMETFV